MAENKESPRTMRTTEKSLEILEMVQRQEKVRPVDVAERFDMSRGSAYTHLATLQNAGYVVQDEEGYRLGCSLISLGQTARTQYTMFDVASSVVSEVSDVTDERVQFMLEEHNELWYICGDSGENGVDTGVEIGASVPIHASAVGKAILAEVNEEKREAILDTVDFDPYNSNTITSRSDFVAELNSVKENGYALNKQEITEWINAVAVSVEVPETTSIGALCVIGPAARLTHERMESEISDILLSYANTFEVKLNKEMEGTISPYDGT